MWTFLERWCFTLYAKLSASRPVTNRPNLEYAVLITPDRPNVLHKADWGDAGKWLGGRSGEFSRPVRYFWVFLRACASRPCIVTPDTAQEERCIGQVRAPWRRQERRLVSENRKSLRRCTIGSCKFGTYFLSPAHINIDRIRTASSPKAMPDRRSSI